MAESGRPAQVRPHRGGAPRRPARTPVLATIRIRSLTH